MELKSKHPMLYNPETLREGIEGYFEWVAEENKRRKEEGEKFKPYTISGICVYLGISKDTWYEYLKKPEMASSIKEARQMVENYVEEGLMNSQLNTIGAVFNLKNNFGWTDKQEVTVNETTSKLTLDEIKETLKKNKKNNV